MYRFYIKFVKSATYQNKLQHDIEGKITIQTRGEKQNSNRQPHHQDTNKPDEIEQKQRNHKLKRGNRE